MNPITSNAMKQLLLSLIVLISFDLCGQDTTRVQAFTFDDISNRREWIEFPSADQTYRKIIMNYTLKCDGQTQQDNFACGEWDYTTFTDLYSYENIGTPYFRLGNQTLDSIPYVSEPYYDYYQSEQVIATYSPVFGELESPWGNDEIDDSDVMRPDRANHRAQYLYLASELGLSAIDIDEMAFNIIADPQEVEWLTIRLAHTGLTDLSSGLLVDQDLETVYEYSTTFSEGWNTLGFIAPFAYDGSSNLIVDITMHSQSPLVGSSTVLRATDSAMEMGLTSEAEERHLDFVGDQYLEVPSDVFATVGDELTISFWAYGDDSTIPFNTWVLEGVDAENRRVVNVHLPWSNGRVYWDAGNAGTNNYDRIDIEVDVADLAGRWTHWAFVKNNTTEMMEMYMDGQLIHSGTGFTRSMAGIERFKLGGRADQPFTGNYDGHIDEFRVWDKALTQEEIADYMFKSVDSAHPSFSSFQLGCDFNEVDGSAVLDYSPSGNDGLMMGLPVRQLREASLMNMNMNTTTIRPDLVFFQLSGDPSFSNQVVTEALVQPLVSVTETLPMVDINISGVTYENIDTSYVYLSGQSTTYAPDGSVITEVEVLATATYYNSFKQNRHQLQNYVTPYGIGLSLGPDGFRWQYEVTDYAAILTGLVEIASGNQQELIDLEFVFIEGTPPRDLLEFETVWLGNYNHAQIADDVVMPAVDRTLRMDASEFMLRARTTGHWFGGFNNCAEFCAKNFNLSIDGTEQFEWLNWKECADNPVIDQGGTWIYDRAGWCPGTFADSYDHDITPFVTPGGTHSIDQGMQAYPTNGGLGNYQHTLQLFQYGAKNFQYDMEVSEIISPNSWEFHNRYNPICADPVIEIRNLGAEVITSLDITYWIDELTSETYQWTGELAFNEREEVTIPTSFEGVWWGSGDHLFHVELSNPNGQSDEHADNDHKVVDFEAPEVIDKDFFIHFKTNNAPNESSYAVYDASGAEMFSRSGMTANTTYKDSLYLPDGCYVFRVDDTGHDGLSFFANSDGNGLCYLKMIEGGTFEVFNTNFGSFINFHFIIDQTVGLTEDFDDEFITVSPNPSSDIFVLSIEGYPGSLVQVEVLDSKGASVYSLIDVDPSIQMRHELNLSNMSDGIYIARVLIDGRQVIRRLIKE